MRPPGRGAGRRPPPRRARSTASYRISASSRRPSCGEHRRLHRERRHHLVGELALLGLAEALHDDLVGRDLLVDPLEPGEGRADVDERAGHALAHRELRGVRLARDDQLADAQLVLEALEVPEHVRLNMERDTVGLARLQIASVRELAEDRVVGGAGSLAIAGGAILGGSLEPVIERRARVER